MVLDLFFPFGYSLNKAEAAFTWTAVFRKWTTDQPSNQPTGLSSRAKKDDNVHASEQNLFSALDFLFKGKFFLPEKER